MRIEQLERTMTTAIPLSSDIIEVYEDRAGEWRWRRKAANHEIVADCGYGYVRKYDAIKAAISRNGEVADLVEIETDTGIKYSSFSVLWRRVLEAREAPDGTADAAG